jgi:N-carbamoyl-L-amino-acid hydrolase
MREDGLDVIIDKIGNIFGLTGQSTGKNPIMIGSHIDTPNNAGKYDGPYGVIAGLEVAEKLRNHPSQSRRPLMIAAFTNEEGVRFQPDMMGSLVYAGGLDVEMALNARDLDGAILRDELRRIGYSGDMTPGAITPHAFLELHIEQGPVLESDNIQIGAVEALQGISWQRITIGGKANHAGTTPTRLRYDAGLAAAHVITFLRRLVTEYSSTSVATVGQLAFKPNSINVVPSQASFTVDLRDPDEFRLCQLEQALDAYLGRLAAEHCVIVETERLARFKPVVFDRGLVEMIVDSARSLEYSVMKMTSGAGHDAQMIAHICPSAMIFVPSRNGISHDPAEYTAPGQLDSGLDVLFDVVLKIAK